MSFGYEERTKINFMRIERVFQRTFHMCLSLLILQIDDANQP